MASGRVPRGLEAGLCGFDAAGPGTRSLGVAAPWADAAAMVPGAMIEITAAMNSGILPTDRCFLAFTVAPLQLSNGSAAHALAAGGSNAALSPSRPVAPAHGLALRP